MPRLTNIDPKSATGDAKAIFDGPLKGKEINIFKAMANAPAAVHTYLGIAGALSKSSLSAKEQEAIHLAVSQANNCEYCLAAHTQLGKGAGLSVDQTIEARQGHVSNDPKLDALVKFALAINSKKGFVEDSDVSAFKKAGYTDQAMIEVLAVYSLAIFTNYFNHLNDTAVDFPAAPELATA